MFLNVSQWCCALDLITHESRRSDGSLVPGDHLSGHTQPLNKVTSLVASDENQVPQAVNLRSGCHNLCHGSL